MGKGSSFIFAPPREEKGGKGGKDRSNEKGRRRTASHLPIIQKKKKRRDVLPVPRTEVKRKEKKDLK